MPSMEWDLKIKKWSKSCPKCLVIYTCDGERWEDGLKIMYTYFGKDDNSADKLQNGCNTCRAGHRMGRISNGYNREQMAEIQEHKCGICKKEILAHNVHTAYIDHDYITGHIRKLLCCRCNTGMGYVDDSNWLEKALVYKKAHT